MARSARLVIPNCPHHVLHRGHNGQAIFASGEDYHFYLENLWECKRNLDCKVYAYCLMPNHVHLLVDPGEDTANLGRLIKRLAGRYTRYLNRLERRHGSLWEGRYRSSPVEAENYLLACSRYIELNPLRAGIVCRPEDYHWSSYREKAGLTESQWLNREHDYLALGGTADERATRYRDWANGLVPDGEWGLIRRSIQSCQLTGSPIFQKRVELLLGKSTLVRPRGRPSKLTPKSWDEDVLAVS